MPNIVAQPNNDYASEIKEPICIAATGDVCGEGVLWEQDTQCIYWTDINRFLVHRYTLKDGALKTWFFSEPVTCVMVTSRKDTLALSLGSGIALWKPDSDAPPTPLFALPGWPFVRCNDAAVDPGGALWVGSMRNNVKENGDAATAGGTDGVLYRVDGTGAASEWRRDLGISNTLLWSPDRSRFYFGDTLQNCIWSYEYDLGARSIRGEQPFFQGFERGLPDGSAIDSEGYRLELPLRRELYRAGSARRKSRSSDRDAGEQADELYLRRPHGNVLYVTSASPEAGHWERFGGGLFALETNVTGMAENQFLLPVISP